MERELANIPKTADSESVDLEALKVIGEAMYRVVVDDDWRIEIPQRLREWLELADEVALVGSIRMIKIWAKSALDEMEVHEEFEKLLVVEEGVKSHG